jgi:disulfide bond formation protein DsbB
MYPQAVLLGLALWKKDKGIALYSLALSIVGSAIAGYHYLLQRGVVPELPCAAVGISESCSQRFVMTFGYITIPLMAFTAFLLLIASMISLRKKSL